MSSLNRIKNLCLVLPLVMVATALANTSGLPIAAPKIGPRALTAIQSSLGGDHSGGGAVTEHDGVYRTFYSAGLYTEGSPYTSFDEIPSLDKLILFLRGFSSVSTESRNHFIDLLLPSVSHAYYRVQEDQFDDETRTRLLAEFSRVTGQPVDSLKLAAVTDTTQKITYLLPEFYKLQPMDQMAILFHESYWLLNPSTTYSEIVAAEMAFEAVIAEPGDAMRIYQLTQYWGDSDDAFLASINLDLSSGALSDLLAPEGIRFDKLLGTDYIQCWRDHHSSSCFTLLKYNLFNLVSHSPRSLLLKRLYDNVSAGLENISSNQNESRYFGFYDQTPRSEDAYDSPLYSSRGVAKKDATYYYDGSASKSIGIPLYLGHWAARFFNGYKYDVIEETLDLSQCFVRVDVKDRFEAGTVELPVQCHTKTAGTITFTMGWIKYDPRF